MNLLIDTEVNSLKAPQLVEVYWLGLTDDFQQNGNSFYSRYKPEAPIDYGAIAAHHILPEDLVGAPPHTDFKLPPGAEYFVGHNIDFDWEVVGKPEVRRVCTLALSRYCWPELDSHTLSALMYFLKGPTDATRSEVRGAHSAMADVLMNLFLLHRIVEKLGLRTMEAAWEKSEEARIPTVMPFGKYKTWKIADIPADYKQWALRQADFDQYVLKAFRISLRRGM